MMQLSSLLWNHFCGYHAVQNCSLPNLLGSHVVERRAHPLVREGIQYFRIDGQFRSERQILHYFVTGKSLLTRFRTRTGPQRGRVGRDQVSSSLSTLGVSPELAAVFGHVGGVLGFAAQRLCSRFIHRSHHKRETITAGVIVERADGFRPFSYAMIVVGQQTVPVHATGTLSGSHRLGPMSGIRRRFEEDG
jgi:hypothetical protein